MAELRKVILVDDEAPARALLREYLSAYPEWVIVQECNNGVDAVRAIAEFRPDLVFLDIQMPGMTGFDVLRHLDEMPQIIFSTAYDQYALEAFEVAAVDYLLKPYTRDRFAKALARVQPAGSADPTELEAFAEQLPRALPKEFPQKLLVRQGRKLLALDSEEIIRLQAEKDYATLYTADNQYLSNQGISQLESRLDPRRFLRVHRSSIINLDHIREIQKYPGGYDVVMVNGDVVRVSRSYVDRIKGLVV